MTDGCCSRRRRTYDGMPFAVSRARHSLLHRCGIVPMKKIFLWVSMAVIIWTAAIADAQERGQSPARVGWLWYGSAPTGALPSLETAIVDGLRELGYVEGKTLVFEHRFADGHPERFQHIAADLVRQKIDVMIGLGGDIAAALKKATSKIPIVVGTSDDAVRASLISSLARPGGNITGVTFVMDELAGKRVQLLKEISPQLSRVGVLWNPAHADSEFKEIEDVTTAYNIKVQSFKVERMNEFDSAFSAINKETLDLLIVVPSRLTSLRMPQIAAVALKLSMPMASGWREFAEAGALLSERF
jgi:putative tryptophan/tyrosine transport system substrate-binding protein